MKRNSVFNSIMLLLLAVCVLVPLALTNTSSRLFLDSDNRYAQEWPTKDEVSAVVAVTLDEESASDNSAENSAENSVEETNASSASEDEENASDVATDEEAARSEERIAYYASETAQESDFLSKLQLFCDTATSIAEGYFNDRIGFRSEAMSAYTLGNDKAFHVMTHPDYDYGLENNLFHSYDFYVAPDDYLELYSNYVVMLSNYCKQRGITFLYVNTPSKEFVYDEYIPDYVPMRKNVFDVIHPIIEEGQVECLDLTDCLRQAKEEGTDVFNTFYDPGHFNTDGAFIASNAILARLQAMGVNVEQADLSDYYAQKIHVNYQSASAYPLDLEVNRYVHISDGTEAIEQPEYKIDLEVSEYSTDLWNWVNTSVDNSTNLLMFQGSYFCSQGSSMYNQFEHAALVRAYINVLNAAYYVDVFQPDVVVFEAADYTIRDGYYNIENLEVADLPPVLTDTYNLDDFESVESPVEYLTYDHEASVANISIPCDTSNIRYVYVESNGVTYDCLVRSDDIHWGIDTSVLHPTQKLDVYCVGYDGQLQTYSVKLIAEQLPFRVSKRLLLLHPNDELTPLLTQATRRECNTQ